MCRVEARLEKEDWTIDFVLSHTIPIEAEPVWAYIPNFDQSLVDKTTERWLQKIHDNLTFQRWYAGHFHIDNEEESIKIMYEDIEELSEV